MESDDLRRELSELRTLVETQARELEALRGELGAQVVGRVEPARVASSDGPAPLSPGGGPDAERSGAHRLSRRALARWGGAAAAGAAASAVLGAAVANPAAAADGDAIKVGLQTNTSTGSGNATVLFVLGGGTYSEGVLTVTDTAFSSFDQTFVPGAITGYAGSKATAPIGVAGYAGAQGTAGVFGVGSAGYGVLGHSESGTGVAGFSGGGITSAAVAATNFGTGYGLAAGSTSGPAILAESTTGIGVEAFSHNTDSPAVIGTNLGSGITGVSGAVVGDSGVSGLPGVLGLGNEGAGVAGQSVGGSPGVSGTSDTGTGVLGSDEGTAVGSGIAGVLTNPGNGSPAVVGSTVGGGVGGKFTAKNAQIQLVPSTVATHPSTGAVGELMVDSTGRLWYCKATKGSGAKGVWVQIA